MNQSTKLHESSCAGLPRAVEAYAPFDLISFDAFFEHVALRGTPNAITFPTLVCHPPSLLFDSGGAGAKAYVSEAAALALPSRRPDRHELRRKGRRDADDARTPDPRRQRR